MDSSLVTPPSGFNSVHGVKSTTHQMTDFMDDEFVVYDKRQQRMKYLIEFSTTADEMAPIVPLDVTKPSEFVGQNFPESASDNSWIFDVNSAKDSSEVVAGLVSDNNNKVPLKSVYVRAKLMDMIGQVSLLQHYKNESNSTLQAKYVLPLDEVNFVSNGR